MLKDYIRKADIVLFIVLIALGLAVTAALAMQHVDAGSDAVVVIKSGGSEYGSYPLSDDQSIEVVAADHGKNIVTISGGSVTVSEASCKNQVCVRHGAISKPGESIICLPNRLVVIIESGEGGGYDSVTS